MAKFQTGGKVGFVSEDGQMKVSLEHPSNAGQVVDFVFGTNADGDAYYLEHAGPNTPEELFEEAFAIAKDYAKQMKLPIAA